MFGRSVKLSVRIYGPTAACITTYGQQINENSVRLLTFGLTY